MTEYRMIPAWAKIKDEILDARTQATINLTKYRQQPCINHKQNFANSVLHLYELLRPKIKYIKTTENGKYQTLQQQLDKITRPPPNPNMKAFTYYYHQLQDACETLGITKIEIPVEATMPPEEAWKEGLPVDIK